MPPQEVGEVFVAIRAIATNFREQASAEVNQALTQVREQATVPIRAQIDTVSANRAAQSFQPVIAGAQKMGAETEGAYRKTESASHHAYERIQASHDGIRAKFGETLRAASLMGGGVALAYGAFSQGRVAIQVTNELAHATGILTAATGLSARQASAWISIAQSQGISSTQLQTSFNGLSRATSSADQAFQKAGASAQANLGKIHAEQIRVTADQIAYTAAVEKYGATAPQAASAAATLASAQNTLKGYVDKTTTSLSGAAGAFSRLGITQQQLQAVQGNLPAELDLIANKFQAMGAGTDRATIAQQLFGRGSSVLVPILAQGAAGIQKNIDVATQYGAVLSGPTLQSMERLRAEQQHLSLEMEGLRVRIATALEPALIGVAGVALNVANRFGTLLVGGINLAKQAMDQFLQSPYGQELKTIGDEAIRFAEMVRSRFERDFTRPLSFVHLFEHFGQDLANNLPRMASNFWTQLNQDLFAPGREVAIRIPARIAAQQIHGAQLPTQQLAGAGLFPGSSFTQQFKAAGQDVVNGFMDGIRAIWNNRVEIAHLFGQVLDEADKLVHEYGPRIGMFMLDAVRGAVNFVVAHASDITRGALEIAIAFISTLEDPAFWTKNWQLMIELAIALFPFGRFRAIPEEILTALGLRDSVVALAKRLGWDKLRQLPETVAVGIIGGSEVLGRAFERVFTSIADHTGYYTSITLDAFGRIGSRLISGLGGLLGRAIGDVLPNAVRKLFDDFDQAVNTAASAALDKTIGRLEGSVVGSVFRRLVLFAIGGTITTALTDFADKVYDSIVKPFNAITGPVGSFVHNMVQLRTVLGVVGGIIAVAFGPPLAVAAAGLLATAVNSGLAAVNLTIYAAVSNASAAATFLLEAATTAASGAMVIFNAVMDANPVILIAAAVIGLGVALYELYQHSATVRRIVHEVWSEMKSIALPVLHAVGDAIRSFVDLGVRLWDRFGGTIKSVIHTAWDYFHGILSAWIGYARSWINLIGDVIHGRWGNIWHDVEHIVGSAVHLAGQILGGLPGTILRLGGVVLSAAVQLGERLVTGLINEAKRIPGDVVTQIQHIGRAIIGLGGWLLREGAMIGSEIVSGVISGIEGAPGAVGDALKNLASGALSDVGGFLGIGSPSRVFRDEVGAPITDGIVKGLDPLREKMTRKLTPVMRAVIGLAQQQNHSQSVTWGQTITAGLEHGLEPLHRRATRAISPVMEAVIGLAQQENHSRSVTMGEVIATGVSHGLRYLHGDMTRAISPVAKNVMDSAIAQNHSQALDLGKRITDDVPTGLLPLGDKMKQSIVPIMHAVMGIAQQQTHADAITTGQGITTGIRSGLDPLQSMLTHSIVTASNGAVAAAKRALGIHSPSSVFAEQIGRPLAEGILHGMGGLERALVQKVTAAAQAAQAAVGGIVSGPHGSAATGANQQLGYHMMLAAGWPASQWGALQALWNRECVPERTMILTRRGWLRHDEVVVGDETIGYNPGTGLSEWTKVTAVHHHDAAVVARVGNAHWSVECTPNHRWLAEEMSRVVGSRPARRYVGEKIRTESLVELRDVRPKHRIVTAKPADTGSGLPITDQEAALLGWVAGDGTIRPNGGYSITQMKGVMDHLVDEVVTADPNWLAYPKRKSSCSLWDGRVVTYWNLSPSYSRELTARVGHPKLDAVAQVLAMSASQRGAWLEAIIAAEGHVEDTGRIVIYQSEGVVADAIILAVYLSGYRPAVHRDERADRIALRIGLTSPTIGGPGRRRHITPIMDVAPVWCVTTELGTWTALQDGNVFLTGNSGWNQYAQNPSSGAYGIPQSLPADKMATAGADWRTNAATQIRWGLDYIRGRYGSPGAAWAHEGQYGWYHRGGVVPGSPTMTYPSFLRGQEVVFTPEQMKALSGRALHIEKVEINNPRSSDDVFKALNEVAQRVG